MTHHVRQNLPLKSKLNRTIVLMSTGGFDERDGSPCINSTNMYVNWRCMFLIVCVKDKTFIVVFRFRSELSLYEILPVRILATYDSLKCQCVFSPLSRARRSTRRET